MYIIIIFNISQTFSFFPRREMTCFAVVSKTRADNDKCLTYLFISEVLVPNSFQDN